MPRQHFGLVSVLSTRSDTTAITFSRAVRLMPSDDSELGSSIKVIPQYRFQPARPDNSRRPRSPPRSAFGEQIVVVVPIAADVIARGLQADQHRPASLPSWPFFAGRQSGGPSPGLVVVAPPKPPGLPPYVVNIAAVVLVALARYAAVGTTTAGAASALPPPHPCASGGMPSVRDRPTAFHFPSAPPPPDLPPAGGGR